ncbi:hypothetical protein BDW59DRAFT_165805 [Aspergillus cavernicola]|uniref:Uncharacterized protein n=1 Tax=Aspergillus cavernicola TaxID=176166 RepID=A0ABR4HQK0_9EURO
MSASSRQMLQASVSVLRRRLGPLKTTYPGPEHDELYPPEYCHKHYQSTECVDCSAADSAIDPVSKDGQQLSCKQLGCDKQSLVRRGRLREALNFNQTPPLKVHIGPVGPGDAVMKSGLHRDATAKEHNLIAFKMEACGIHDTGSGTGSQAHALNHGEDSIVPKGLHKAVPKKIERALPNKNHNAGNE